MSKIDSAEKNYIMWRNIYVLFVVLYAFGIVYNSAMPITGDDIAFYTTLKQGNQLWHGLAFEFGRFFPLAGWNLNLVALFSTSPYAFMIGNACVFIVTAWAFWRIGVTLCAFSSSNYYGGGGYICIAFVAFSLSGGYTNIVASLCYPELTETLFLLFFIILAFRYYQNKKTIWLILALIFGNACIYMKEVAFILIGGFGFFHLFFTLWNEDFKFEILEKKIVLFDVLCMLSAILFLGLYIFFTFESKSDYRELIPFFSILRTILISGLGTPFLSIILPILVLIRLFAVIRYREQWNAFGDTLAVIAVLYWGAYLAMGMASYHYYVPANILAFLYVLFFFKYYANKIGFFFARFVLCVSVGILFVSDIPMGLHNLGIFKTQVKNTQDAFNFLAEYIRKSPKKVDLYFDGFCRGYDKCHYYYFMYPTLFQNLPNYYGVTDNYDIKSKEPNGNNFTINPNSPLTFFNSDEVSEPQSGDIVILHYMSSKYMTPSDVQDIVAQYEVLFVSNNYPYYPMYNLMSLGAWVLKKLGISTSFDNRGNIFKLPSQVYVLRVP